MLDNRQTFAEYAAYVLELKERSGTKSKTIDRYRELMGRINQAIGHMKLADIRPQHLNSFYKNLSEPGIRETEGIATARIDLAAWLKANKKAEPVLRKLPVWGPLRSAPPPRVTPSGRRKLGQHRTIVPASLSRLFAPLLQFEKREILRSRCQYKLAYGCGIPLAGTYSIPSFSKL